MSDENIEEKYANLLKIKKHIDDIRDDWDEETLAELKEFLQEKYSKNGEIPASKDSPAPSYVLSDANGSVSGVGFFSRIKDAFESDVGIDPGRLTGLTDGIFGMVMTLLVFGIAIPEMVITNYSDFISFFSSLAPTIGVTIVGFVIISSFWIYHHEYIKVKNLNIIYLWLNIVFLICLSFIPFTTSLIGNYSKFFLSEVMFGINILFTIVSFLLMYVYAYKKDYLEEKPSNKENKHVLITLASIMGLTIIVNLLDFHVSSNFIYLFLLIPVISTILDIMFKYNNS